MTEESGRGEAARRARLEREVEALRAEELLQRNRQFRRISISATLLAAIGAMLSVVVLITESVDRKDPFAAIFEPAKARGERELADQRRQLDQLRHDLQRAMSNLPAPSGVPKATEMIVLNKRLDAIEAEQKRLSAVISESPEKAVAIPLMRREIDDVKGSQTQIAEALKREIDRIYDLNKWIIGGLAVGVIGLLVRDIFRSRAQSD